MASAVLIENRFTYGEPNAPRYTGAEYFATSALTSATGRLSAFATAFTCASASAGDMSGSMPLPEPVTSPFVGVIPSFFKAAICWTTCS